MAISATTIRQLAIALCSEDAARDIAQAIASGGGGGAVTSVAGRTGAVTLAYADISGLGTAAQHAVADFDAAGAAAAVTKSSIGLGSVENTAISTWAGGTAITTLGTVATGIWHGTAIADAYIASAATWNLTRYEPFSFGGTGTPATGTDVTSWAYAGASCTAARLTLSCKSAPSGNFQVTIKRSADGGSTFPDTVASVTVGSGAKLATTTSFTNAALAAGDVLRCDIISVNAAADWTARLEVSR